jgi:ribonuclease P protein component
VAYAIGRSIGLAVTRNRLRRRLRAVLVELTLAPGSYLVIAAPGAAGLEFAELRSLVRDALGDVSGGA